MKGLTTHSDLPIGLRNICFGGTAATLQNRAAEPLRLKTLCGR